MWKSKIFWNLITFIFLNDSLFADIIYLKDGRVLFVKVINQDMDQVTVSNDRETWDLEKKKVSRISFNEDEEVYVRNQLR
ncbi:LA_0442/LA_0875 N-terminal domain-containing protein [Leptospira stimsonii]|uniref:LA_0442/LA_0875 N-terminal domain-containing protein n=1 Tax=Leptospira stimsonii TaxID=2202203 RepID=UPI003CCFEE05